MSRTEAREQALGVLYATDVLGAEEPDTTEVSARAKRYVDGVWAHRAELDRAISEVATGWRVERMPAVDRNILRLGLYELRHTGTPVGVVVSEAVELAKRFSTGRSGSFVNGVLAKLADAEGPSV